MQLAETVTFGGSGLDRAAHLRADTAALKEMRADPAARILPIWRGKPLFMNDGQVGWIKPGHPVLTSASEAPVFLGLDDGGPRFASDISAWEPEELPDTLGAFFDPSQQLHPELPNEFAFGELRGVMTLLTARDAELVATAKAILGWHTTHSYCARCGGKSVIVMGGWQRDCATCGGHHFPRTDPVVIMLITRGNKVLIGRSPEWPEGMYSLLAGFVEPGETLEAAVRREVLEEAGIRVGAVEYLASQPWPFPASLMFGCRGEATSDEITVDPEELEDARWITREDMMDVFAGRNNSIKPARKGAIAHFIIWNWMAERLE